jgi:hypothetical protein
MVFGYTGREDLVDSKGNKWRPGCEFVVRIPAAKGLLDWSEAAKRLDSLREVWWINPSHLKYKYGTVEISNTSDPELYGYGIHAPEFVVNVTVGPGKYYARLKLAGTRGVDTKTNCVTILINGQEVVSKMDIAATAGGANKAMDLIFNDIAPRNGVIDIRFIGGDPAAGKPGEAILQALEVGPGECAVKGADPVKALE